MKAERLCMYVRSVKVYLTFRIFFVWFNFQSIITPALSHMQLIPKKCSTAYSYFLSTTSWKRWRGSAGPLPLFVIVNTKYHALRVYECLMKGGDENNKRGKGGRSQSTMILHLLTISSSWLSRRT